MLITMLSIFLGGLGVDRLVSGRIGLGIAKLLTCGGCGIWSLVDTILLLTESYRDGSGNTLHPSEPKQKTIAIVVLAIALLLNILLVIAQKDQFTATP